MTDSTAVTRLLRAWCDGDAPARDQLVAHVYDELHRIAQRHLRSERPDHTLQSTALTHGGGPRAKRQSPPSALLRQSQ